MNELIIIKTTVRNKVTRENIINELIKNDYVSCINLIENVSSYYKWQGKVENEFITGTTIDIDGGWILS